MCRVGRSSVEDAAGKTLFLRTYSRTVTLLPLDGATGSRELDRELSDAGVRVSKAHVTALARLGDRLAVALSDGREQVFDVVYPVLGRC
jgi:thioredoxin reductase (NADPH)